MSILPDALTPTTLDALTTCPPWCTKPDGHEPDDVESDGTVYVWHRRPAMLAGGRRVALQQCVMLIEGRDLRVAPAEIVVDGQLDRPLDVDTARAFIAGLALTAELAAGGVR
ncbi:DUF6907 domain-containing protein [Pseudonocardia xishanensis]|uniref:DUF6907 domain-containing protein n=1 Tax=Pseudonocardia xishanensis TaxID=630995 RepID=UPI0031E639FD